ncbi:hypothetical protein ACF3DV_33620 (plasmid) [Chlorogloeopsis fritschii PCC 9212]|nr:hypothetical protein [Chlorogloeopsis fritschii]
MRRNYLTDEQWQRLRSHLPPVFTTKLSKVTSCAGILFFAIVQNLMFRFA